MSCCKWRSTLRLAVDARVYACRCACARADACRVHAVCRLFCCAACRYLPSGASGISHPRPLQVAHHARVAAQPGIAAYLSSGKQFAKVNNNGLG